MRLAQRVGTNAEPETNEEISQMRQKFENVSPLIFYTLLGQSSYCEQNGEAADLRWSTNAF